MKWLEKKTDKGILKYRMPDCSEGYEYLAMIDQLESYKEVFRVRGKFIKMMGELVLYKDLGYNTYQEALDDKENMFQPLTEIAEEILNDVTEALGKKS